MPEFPDVALYIEALTERLAGRVIREVRLHKPFVLRTVDPPLTALRGRAARGFSRLGKRIVFECDPDLFLVVHLMIAGRLRWREGAQKAPPSKLILAELTFEHGRLYVTEAGSTRRAAMHVVLGREALAKLDPGGIDPLTAPLDEFRAAMVRDSHTLKRALTDPSVLSGIGNAYSDEILWEAGLHPHRRRSTMDEADIRRLYYAMRSTLEWARPILEAEVAEGLYQSNDEWRAHLRVHRKGGEPCPRCGNEVKSQVRGGSETNYCLHCQPLVLG